MSTLTTHDVTHDTTHEAARVAAVGSRPGGSRPAGSPARARTVPLEELRRAWAALEAGDFRPQHPANPTAQTPTTQTASIRTAMVPTAPAVGPPMIEPAAWAPAEDEQVLPVVGCGGSCGASTLAVALATVGMATVGMATGGAPQRAAGDIAPARNSVALDAARVVDCGSLTASGLAAASTSELGRHPSGWRRGTRGDVLLERADGYVAGPDTVAPPCPWPVPGRARRLTVLDVGWDLERILYRPSWIRTNLLAAQCLVLVTTATVPGLRRLEIHLDLLAAASGRCAASGESATAAESHATVVAAVQGPSRRRWPRPVAQSLGARSRALDEQGRLTVTPHNRRLAVSGLDPEPLPASLLAAAARLLDQIPHGARGATR